MKIFVLIIFCELIGIKSVNCQRKIEIPDYERPKMDYVKVQFNCMDKSMYMAKNLEMRVFYESVNIHIKSFLKLVKKNDMDLEQFVATTKLLKEEFTAFQRNFSVSAINCTNWLSYKNLNATVNNTILILGFMSGLNEEQYRGRLLKLAKPLVQ